MPINLKNMTSNNLGQMNMTPAIDIKKIFSPSLTGGARAASGVLSVNNSIGRASFFLNIRQAFGTNETTHGDKNSVFKSVETIGFSPISYDQYMEPISAYEVKNKSVFYTDKNNNSYGIVLHPLTLVIRKSNISLLADDERTASGPNVKYTKNGEVQRVIGTLYGYMLYRNDDCIHCDTSCKSDDIIADAQNGYFMGDPTEEQAFLDALHDWLFNYNIYDGVVGMAKTLQNIGAYIRDAKIIEYIHSSGTPSLLDALCRTLEHFSISLDNYRTLYNHINTVYGPTGQQCVRSACAKNANLLTFTVLDFLETAKSSGKLATPIKNPDPSVIADPYSDQQKAAILNEDTLAMIQSVAGSGKSTVIQERIKYMVHCGCDVNDILVLSFTNAAADHVEEICPGVKSMTIATMVNSIYKVTYPSHALSETSTFCNVAKGQLTSSNTQNAQYRDFAQDLTMLLTRAEDGESSAVTQLMNLVHDNFTDVIDLCNTIKMTTLTLQLLISNENMLNMQIPNTVYAHHMIIDEVQDNSMFEFIYLMTYAGVMGTSLFLVGDCSQTLYEFRNANPTALNTLESSGLFTTYKLETNYRSNAEILALADGLLGNLATNRISQLHLHADSLVPITPDSFRNAVHFTEYPKTGGKDVSAEDHWRSLLYHSDYGVESPLEYLVNAVATGESVAVLTPTRRYANMLRTLIDDISANSSTISLSTCSIVPVLPYTNEVFSKFIAEKWKGISALPISSTVDAILDGVAKYVPGGPDSDRHKNGLRYVGNFRQMYGTHCIMLYNLWVSGQITNDGYFDTLRQYMLSYENITNQNAQQRASVRNQNLKEAAKNSNNAITFSTIHSAKGLEYDHVLVLYDGTEETESSMRMNYVALTRAKKTEYVVELTARNNQNDGLISNVYASLANDNTAAVNATA